MKKVMIAMLVVFIGQMSFAAMSAGEVKAKAEIRASVEKSSIAIELKKAVESGKDFTKDNALMSKLNIGLDKALKDKVAYDQTKLLSLMAIDPVTMLTEISHISKQLADVNVPEARKAQLKTKLELILENSGHLKATARTEAEAKENMTSLSNALELAENLSHLDFASAQPMVKKVKSLLKSEPLEEAINKAGKGAGKDGKDVTVEDIKKDC